MSKMRKLLFDPVLSLKIYLQRLSISISIVLLILLTSPRWNDSSSDQISEKWRRYISFDDASYYWTYRSEFVGNDFLGLIILVGFLLAAYNWAYVLNITRDHLHTWSVLTNQEHKHEYINNDDDQPHDSGGFLFLFIMIFSIYWGVMKSDCYLMEISSFDDLSNWWVSYVATASWLFWEGDETFKIIKFPIACFGYYSFFKLSKKLADISNSRKSSTDYHMPFSFAGLWGCCHSYSGYLKVRPIYEEVDNFSIQTPDAADEPIGVKVKGRWGYVFAFGWEASYNGRQKLCIKAKYTGVGRFIDGLASVRLDGRTGFVDKNNREYWDMNEDEARQKLEAWLKSYREAF